MLETLTARKQNWKMEGKTSLQTDFVYLFAKSLLFRVPFISGKESSVYNT